MNLDVVGWGLFVSSRIKYRQRTYGREQQKQRTRKLRIETQAANWSNQTSPQEGIAS